MNIFHSHAITFRSHMLFWFVLALFMTIASFGFGQTCSNHTVTATIVDSDAQPWINGTFTVSVSNPSGGQRPVCRATGVPITTSFSGTLNAFGLLSISLPDTSKVDPPIQWVFTIQSLTSALPSIMNPVSVTANVNLSTSFSSQVLVPRFTGIKNAFGYLTGEFQLPVLGSTMLITNTTPNVCNIFTTLGWVSCGAASGSGTVNPGAAGQVAYYATNGIALSPFSIGHGSIGATGQSFGGEIDSAQFFTVIMDVGAPPGTTGINCLTTARRGLFYQNVTDGSWYSCNQTGLSTSAWQPFDVLAWNQVTMTNNPTSATGQACVSNGTANSCTWGNVVITLPLRAWACQPGLGDGLNAITAATYLNTGCKNTTGTTVTLTAFQCFTDNNGTSSVNVTNSAATALLTGAITCTNSFASGTQSATVTLANGDYLKWTFIADGASKQTTWLVSGTY